MDIISIIKLIIMCLGYLYALIQIITSIVKSIKEKNLNALKETLTNKLVPLMEEAERIFGSGNGEEKETWVIEKLAKQEHIDFYKHKDILKLVMSLIETIVDGTKIEVNKVFEIKEEETKAEESVTYDTNGIS